ncbi:MAG: lysylphosphatidylglycerol synthase transmembrane domain-containing protein [Candidatus Zixiibacteriota bacterium]
MQQKRLLYLVVGVGISLVLLWALFRNVDFSELVTALKEANYWWLLPNLFFVVFAMHQRAYRWRFMLAPIKAVTYPKLLAATCIGFMANNVLPLRLGEFVRAYSLSYQDPGVTKSASLGTIFIERMVFDLVVLLFIFGAVVASSHMALHDDMKQGTLLAVLIALVGVIFVIILALRPAASGKVIAKLLFFAPERVRQSVQGTVLKFSRGLEFIKDTKTLVWVFVQTVVLWLFMGLSNYFVFLAFGFDLPLTASFVLLVVVSISILIPSSPGYVGVYHYGTVWTLASYGIAKEQALSFALVLHAAQYIPITLMGFYYLKKEHLSLKRLEAEAVEKTD